MIELVKVSYDSERPTVGGRALHDALRIETRYNDWFKRMCEYGFEEGTDFYSILSKTSDNGRPSTDHQLTIAMAKELCMIQRSEIGRKFRQYFIEVEEAWNSPEMVMSRALRMAEGKIKSLQADKTALQAQLEADMPYTGFAKAIAANSDAILLGDFAKICCNSKGIKIGRNRLFRWLRHRGYLMKNNRPYQRYIDQGLFQVRENSITTVKGSLITITTLVTGKGQLVLLDALQEEFPCSFSA